MDLRQAERLARTLIKQHAPRGWSFRWDRAKQRYGQCDYTNKVISLSRALTPLQEPAQVQDTILHEIAHIKAGGRAGHGPVWKAHAAALGARPERCGQGIVLPAPWVATCPVCKVVHRRFRLTQQIRSASCAECDPTGRGRAERRLKWTRNVP
jgi:hypothetical protein